MCESTSRSPSNQIEMRASSQVNLTLLFFAVRSRLRCWSSSHLENESHIYGPDATLDKENGKRAELWSERRLNDYDDIRSHSLPAFR